jgi:tetratricopeptide (TPR) repeat protein
MLLARAEDLSGNRGRAAVSLEVARSLRVSDSPDSDLVARMYRTAGLPSAAARVLEDEKEGSALERVRLLLAAGRRRAALLLLEKTEGTEARMLEARIHMERGAYALALKSLEQAEDGQKARYAKGLCLWRLGRYQEAGGIFAELATDPDWSGKVRELVARMQALAVLEAE